MLRKLESGEIICTVDERPKKGEWSYSALHDNQPFQITWNATFYTIDKIIASTIPNVGKELKVDTISFMSISDEEWFEKLEKQGQYEYTELETSIIIKL